ncbi:phosphocholine cytidylyltransferase family protein [Azospirillum isscasi]|uniref:Phosphocholine cytidylyltransferase family protein n=1 Tax=Azospirillum isscasi TaxID=3053926 RepID=A0ABU0WJ39_9PROT|nr:phosphocholine cytidylyltransferase family protein [Azospirillum isscasi]MDQ2104235.1 phosphocholine cytidylyltransferase family protein [Azospirillum isscasi]
MKAILLAAGRGSRLGAVTDTHPKCYVRLHGRPLVEWQIEALTAAGIGEIAVVRGYLAEFWDRQTLPVTRFFTNDRWQRTNMVASLACAGEWLADGPCVVSYTDIVYSPDSVRTLLAAPGDIAITYDPDWFSLWSQRFADPLDDAETFQVDTQGRLTGIGARPKALAEVGGQYMGLLRLTPDGWRTVTDCIASLPAAEADRLDMTGLLSRLLARGVEIRAVPIAEPWCEVDQQSDLSVAERIFSPQGNTGR